MPKFRFGLTFSELIRILTIVDLAEGYGKEMEGTTFTHVLTGEVFTIPLPRTEQSDPKETP